MGSSSSPLEFAGKLRASAGGLSEVGKKGTEAGAQIVKELILAGTPDRLSGVGKKGAKLGVRYNVGEYPDGAKALIFATGPFHLIERDTAEHMIFSSGVGKIKGRRTAANKHAAKQELYNALFGDGGGGGFLGSDARGFAASGAVHHPGTRGKHPFAKGVTAAEPLVPKVYDAAVLGELRAIF